MSIKSIANELNLIVQNAKVLIQNEEVLEGNRSSNGEHDILDTLRNRNMENSILRMAPRDTSCTSSVTTSSTSNYITSGTEGSMPRDNSRQISFGSNKRIKLGPVAARQIQFDGGVNTSANALAYERRCVIRQMERLLQEFEKQFQMESERTSSHCPDDKNIYNYDHEGILGNLVMIMTDILPYWLVTAASIITAKHASAVVNPISAAAVTGTQISPMLQRCVSITQLCAKLIMHCIHPTTSCMTQPPSVHIISLIIESVFNLCSVIRRDSQATAFKRSAGTSALSPSTPQEIQRESLLHLLTYLITILNTTVMLTTSSSMDRKILNDNNEPLLFEEISDNMGQETYDLPPLLFPKLNCRQTIDFIVTLLHIFLENNELFISTRFSHSTDNNFEEDSSLHSLSQEVIHFQFSILIGDLFSQLSSIVNFLNSSSLTESVGKQSPTLLSALLQGPKLTLGVHHSVCNDELIEDYVELANLFVSQTLENATDAINLVQTLWRRNSQATFNETAPFRAFDDDHIEDLKEKQPIDEILHLFQLVIQSIALSVNLVETIAPDQAMFQINIPQHLLSSFFHAFATLVSSGACQDLINLDGEIQRTNDQEEDQTQLSQADQRDGSDTESSCSSFTSRSIIEAVSPAEVETLISFESMLVRLIKVISSSSDRGSSSSEMQIIDMSFKRKKLALELALLSTFDSHGVTRSCIEFMLKRTSSRCEDVKVKEIELSWGDTASLYHTDVELYETSKLLQAALLSSIMMSSSTSSLLHCVQPTTECAFETTSSLLSVKESPIVEALLHTPCVFNPWNSFLARKLPDQKQQGTAINKISSTRICFDTLQLSTEDNIT